MQSFQHQIAPFAPKPADLKSRRWIYIPYDRYTDRTGPLTEQPAAQTGIVIVESTAKALRRPYHKKKLVVLISNMRHFALEQAAKGVKVLYHFSPDSHGQALLHLQQSNKLPAITCMTPAERELRLDLHQAQQQGLDITFAEDTTWASSTKDFTTVYGPYKQGKSYVMDRFYRRMRQQTGILMQNAKPIGGQFSFDADNRSPYKHEVPVPTPPTYPPDTITQEVIALVEQTYAHHFGTTEDFDLPCTQSDSDAFWQFFLTHQLPHFGRFEDAMRDDHLQLFHSKTSVLLNLGRLLAMDLIRDVAARAAEGTAPMASCEGFIRQLLGWREFMRHLHEQTDGYRLLAGHVPQEPRKVPHEFSPDAPGAPRLDSETWVQGATPSALGASLTLPAAYWGIESGLHCLDTVVKQVIHEGWSHHITRLMVLSNLANLCGFSPRELTDWFWFAYVDAYDWVVEPNVLGMATYADGGLTATKPYVSGAAYINRMSNYCGHCQYDPKKSTGPGSCPFTSLYWTFLERNEDKLSGNFRMQMPYNTLHKKKPEELVQLRTRAAEAITDLQSFKRPKY
ncbi:cryptochrome/photolyase family protein [Granulicella tundricola]|uniref:Deoxyribodipyrimidine photolyase-related protein n=1 Tax=Granulicella tundricola (strain ATCC BAA-1859 / DSM 23138 / MP5ACTX9) TaxID=1198114 RepID=E8WYU4_GRATM|nr:cryptochrome/photolyase family protein [Granulicella tundricola]ADW68780.1 deoxyribodipyrimidine photolyase-related protein [Granulicella tundricola MP5ACTX9]